MSENRESIPKSCGFGMKRDTRSAVINEHSNDLDRKCMLVQCNWSIITAGFKDDVISE